MEREVKWSITNKFGIAAIIASIAIPLTQIIAPLVGNWYNMKCQIEVNREIEFNKRKIEINKILFENYFGKDNKQQLQTIRIIAANFPDEMRGMHKILIEYASDKIIIEKEMQLVTDITKQLDMVRKILGSASRIIEVSH